MHLFDALSTNHDMANLRQNTPATATQPPNLPRISPTQDAARQTVFQHCITNVCQAPVLASREDADTAAKPVHTTSLDVRFQEHVQPALQAGGKACQDLVRK